MGQIVGFAGSFSTPSRTRQLVQRAVDQTARRSGREGLVFDLGDLGASLCAAQRLGDLAPGARSLVDSLIAADALIVGTPVYKGSYTGLFKHLFDLLDPVVLRGKPVLITATGGGYRHALVIEHQLRPLFGFFEARVVPLGVYAASADLEGDSLADDITARLETAVGQLVDDLAPVRPLPQSATAA